jgi:hypothetical protein
MSDALSRRDLLKVLGVAGAGMLVAQPAETSPPVPQVTPAALPVPPDGEITPLVSTSEVFIPPRGQSYNTFSFDFPEPSVAFAGYRFGFMVFSHENAYGLDINGMKATITGDTMALVADGLVWAGGQERKAGKVTATFRQAGDVITWDTVVEMDVPIKTITTVIRGIPRGRLSFGGGGFGRTSDDEVLVGYPFSGGDLFGGNTAGGMGSPVAAVQSGDQQFVAISSLDDRVRTKRFFFQPGESGFRVEAIHEAEGWLQQKKLVVPTWRLIRGTSADAVIKPHFDQVVQAHHLEKWETRADVPNWLRDVALVTTLHGQHYTGYIFNDYAKMLDTLKWMATQIPANRVLAFLSSWDGRYYLDYPNYRVNDRMGGEAGFHRLVDEAHKLGFRIMPMYGTNSANRNQPAFAKVADAAVAKIDGDVMDLNWVDWDNDRHQEGWLAYMNLGVDSWRAWLEGRISEMISRFGVDAYFLDIVGGHVNNTRADMHEGTRKLVMNLRAKFPKVPCVGEMAYDALLEFIPMYHVGVGSRLQPYARYFQHLSHPAPGRGSSGVHESGFGRFDPVTLSLAPSAIPTLNVVDDTFAKYRDVMAAVIAKAKERAGIG